MCQGEKGYLNMRLCMGMVGIILLIMLFISLLSYFEKKYIGLDSSISALLSIVLDNALALTIFYFIRKKKGVKTNMVFTLSHVNKKVIPLMIIALLTLSYGIVSPISDSIPIPEAVKAILDKALGGNDDEGFFLFLAIVIAAPIGEELIYRGTILDGLLNRYSTVKAIVVSALIFAFIHFIPWQMPSAFVLGLFFAWIYYASNRNVTLTIILHAIANLSFNLEEYFFEGGLLKTLNMSVRITLVLSCIVVAVISIRLLHKIFTRQKFLETVEGKR